MCDLEEARPRVAAPGGDDPSTHNIRRQAASVQQPLAADGAWPRQDRWCSAAAEAGVVGDITNVQTIALGRRIHQLNRLKELYGKGRWRKMKGEALIRLTPGAVRRAELHWYEAHGIGKRNMKSKRDLD